MLSSVNRKYPFPKILKFNLRTTFSISLGVFLFLLFFQPLKSQSSDFNNQLLILATLGAITLVLLSIVRIIIPSFFPKAFSANKWTLLKEIVLDFLFVASNSVAFVFFAKYVALVEITFHVVIIIVIISICAMVSYLVVVEFYELRKLVVKLSKRSSGKKEIKNHDVREIEFKSDNKSEYFHLFPEQIILIKSANNYIEVIYKLNDKVQKKLIRNTLKATENLLSEHKEMIRCHRSCIVNKNYIQKINKSSDGLKLELFDYAQEIHVSRQYVLKVKEALKS